MRQRPRAEVGAAVTDFTLVSLLVLVLFAAALQLGLALHVRNTLISCASEGARLGARADASQAEGVQRTKELIGSALSDRFAEDVTSSTEVVGGVEVVVVHVVAPLPVFGPLGPADGIDIVGRAYREAQ